MIRALLAADRDNVLHTFRVKFVDGVPALTRWQRALIEKLNRDAGDTVSLDAALEEVLECVLTGACEPAPGALGVLQSRLYRPGDTRVPNDTSVQWLGVRDFLQEAEVAVGMVQSMLSATPPRARADRAAAAGRFRVFRRGRGCVPPAGRRCLGRRRAVAPSRREAVFHFLYRRQKPAPAMALAVVVVTADAVVVRAGRAVAQAVTDGDDALKRRKGRLRSRGRCSRCCVRGS